MIYIEAWDIAFTIFILYAALFAAMFEDRREYFG